MARATQETGYSRYLRVAVINNDGEFDPGSERTLAARLKHASRTANCLRTV